jgi:hypothetical protein
MTGCAILRDLAAKADAVGHLDHAERLSLLYSFGHLGAPGASAIHTIIGRCRNYDRRETDRQVARLSGLPIGCTRLREKHATEKTLPLCNCDFGRVRQRGGYPTPLLHIGGFRRAWRDELRGRRTVERRHAAGAEGVVVQTEPVEEVHRAETPSARDSVEWGAVVGTAPPHTWA